jgi:hypothetical protein
MFSGSVVTKIKFGRQESYTYFVQSDEWLVQNVLTPTFSG